MPGRELPRREGKLLPGRRAWLPQGWGGGVYCDARVRVWAGQVVGGVSVVSVVMGTPFRLAQLARSDEPARPDPRRRRPNRRAPSGLLLPTLPTITKAASCRPRVTSRRLRHASPPTREHWPQGSRPPSPQLRAVGEAERSRSFGRRCFRAATRAGGTIDCRTPFPQNGFRAVDGGDRTSGRIQSGRGTVP